MAMVPAANAAAAFPRYSKRSTHIRIHRTVTSIPNQAFFAYDKLVAVELPEGLERIGVKAFCGCTTLTEIRIPSNVDRIEDGTFNGCKSLKNIHLCEGLRRIGKKAFCDCTSLTSISIPSTVVSIGESAFQGCTSLKDIRLCEGLQRIASQAFLQCISLESIDIPSTVVSIDEKAFFACQSLKEIFLKEGLQAIHSAFYYCPSLTHISIPSTVTALGNFTFGFSSIEKVILCEGLHAIKRSAFCKCDGLERIRIPSTVTTIEGWAFYSCEKLKYVYFCDGPNAIGGANVTSIGGEAFNDCTSLVNVRLRDGLLSICSKTFYGCKSLLTINIPSTVTSINEDAFSECNFLRNVFISPSSTLGQAEYEAAFGSIADLGCTYDMLRSRFDDLPVHRLCFHHAHQTLEYNNIYELLKEMVRYRRTNGAKLDCLGMTPLHVLACSGTHDLRLYRCLIDNFPRAMITKDKWGEPPLVYVLLSEPPMEIIHYFFEMYWRKWGKLPIDFGEMIKSLAKCKSKEYLNFTIKAQRTYFPNLKVDWPGILADVLACDGPGTCGELLKASAFYGSSRMSHDHSLEIGQLVSDIVESTSYDAKKFDELYRLQIGYTMLHHADLKNACTVLELAIWRALLNESLQLHQSTNIVRNVRKKMRLDCGRVFQIVIPHVLSFL